jgi:hypothetical protein
MPTIGPALNRILEQALIHDALRGCAADPG